MISQLLFHATIQTNKHTCIISDLETLSKIFLRMETLCLKLTKPKWTVRCVQPICQKKKMNELQHEMFYI